MINQAEVPAEEDLVKLVANLCKTYAKTDTCINLLALPMTDDAANSTASKLVHELGAEDRTLGVLTKVSLFILACLPLQVILNLTSNFASRTEFKVRRA